MNGFVNRLLKNWTMLRTFRMSLVILSNNAMYKHKDARISKTRFHRHIPIDLRSERAKSLNLATGGFLLSLLNKNIYSVPSSKETVFCNFVLSTADDQSELLRMHISPV